MNANLPTDETMSEGSPVPPDQDQDQDMGGGMAAGEICVPLASLAQPDESEQMQPPAVGDKSSAQVDYTVTRIEGENAYITLDGVNGQPIANSEAPEAGGPDELDQLKQQAAAMPQGY